MSAASKLLDRLTRVKATGAGRWIARCPAHEDRSPSLSIRELDDGRVLAHCFAGCDVRDVLGAIGLTLAALFDKPLARHLPPSRSNIPARDLLDVAGHEIDAAGVLLAEIVEGRGCSELAWERLAQASQRINRARVHMHGR